MNRQQSFEATGDCFERSYNLLVLGDWRGCKKRSFIGEPLLVHGVVWHEKSGHHSHGWVEDDLFCYDFLPSGCMLVLPKALYYRAGFVGETRKYNRKEAIVQSTLVGFYYFSNLPVDK